MRLFNESVKFSVERLQRYGTDYPQFQNDVDKVVYAISRYLDETPADGPWVRCFGAEADFQHYFEELFSVPDGFKEGDPVPKLSTRGAVRTLCDVLDVPTREVG